MTAAPPSAWTPSWSEDTTEAITVVAVGPARRDATLSATLLGLGLFALYCLAVPGAIDGLDAQAMSGVTRSLLDHGGVDISSAYGVPGLHGLSYSKYGPAQSLLASPLFLLGHTLSGLAPAFYRPEVPTLVASFLPALLTALTAVLLVLTAIELGASTRGALMLGLVYGLATPAAVYAVQWFSEPAAACALLAAVYAVIRDRAGPTVWRPLLAGLTLSIAAATRLDALLFAPVVLLYLRVPVHRRRARALALVLPLVVTLGALGLYDLARFGSPLQTGYGLGTLNPFDSIDTHPDRSPDAILSALYGLFLSPGKGLVEYAPVVLLAPFGLVLLWRRRRAETALLLALILVDSVAHANILIRWVGGWSWGPRFLVPVIPLVLLLAAPLLRPGRWRRNPATTALVVLGIVGFAVQLPALIVHEPHTSLYDLRPAYDALPPTVDTQAARRTWIDNTLRMERDYVAMPSSSPIVMGWQALWRPGTWTPRSAPVVAPTNVDGHSVTTAPHTWQRLLDEQGAPAGPLLLVSALLALTGLALLNGAFARARR